MDCPNAEILAALGEQRLDPQERETVLDHAAGCDECRRTLLIVGSERPAVVRLRPPARIRPVGRSWVPWAAAAALAVSIVGLLLFAGQTRPKGAGAPEPEEVRTAEVPAPREAEPIRPPQQKTPPQPEKPVVPVRPPAEPPPVPREVPAPKEPERPPTPVVPVPPAVEKPIPLPPPTPEPPKPPTVTVVATLEGVEGEVFVRGAKGRTKAKPGQPILPGEGLECVGTRSGAFVSYADKTRLELGGDTAIRDMIDRDGTRGRRLFVEKGTVKAEVSKQPADQAMVFESSHGEAKVLGTVLCIQVDKGMRLEVEEGKVELKDLTGRTVRVEGGHQAVAAAGVPMTAKLLPKEEILLAYDFEDGKRPAFVADKGSVERGPGNRLCLAGDAEGGGSSRLFIGDGANGLFTFQGDEVLSFDYWVDPQASSVNFNFWNRTQGQTQDGAVAKLVVGKWARATFRLEDLGEPGNRMKEGDWIVNLYIQGTGGPPRRFYLDNLLIVRSRVLKPRTVETKK